MLYFCKPAISMSSLATADGFELLGGDPALEDANQMDNTELRLAIKQIPKARSKLERRARTPRSASLLVERSLYEASYGSFT